MSLRVVIADDEPLIRAGFEMMLGPDPDIVVVGNAADGDEAIALAQRERPDVVVMDIQMPHRNGIEATREICRTLPSRVLIVTTFDLDEYVYEALRGGASGFLLKNSPPEELVRAIHLVASGESLVAPSITRRLIERFGPRGTYRPQPKAMEDLTDRETEVLGYVARGWSNQQIADHLVIGLGTVKTHVAHILAKLQLSDRVQAVVLAYETGLIRPGDHPR